MNSTQLSDISVSLADAHPESYQQTKINDWRDFRPGEVIHLGVRFCQIGKIARSNVQALLGLVL